jgi:uroporphyrinogen-III synthase
LAGEVRRPEFTPKPAERRAFFIHGTDNGFMDDHALVLVTRAGQAGERLTRLLSRYGQDAVHCSPVRLDGPEDPEAITQRLHELLPVDQVIMTSGEAIHQVVRLVGSEAFASIPIIVPGPGSARKAESLGLQSVISPPSAGNSEAMLKLPELDHVDGKSILIMAAAGGRRLLETELRRRGARVQRIHVYRRLDQVLPEGLDLRIRDANILSTLISSGGALQALESLLEPEAWRKVVAGRVVVPSPRVAEMASRSGCRNVIQADGADDESMLKALG